MISVNRVLLESALVKVFKSVDLDKSNTVSFEEWTGAFEAIDTQHNGVISRKQWQIYQGQTCVFDSILNKRHISSLSRLEWVQTFEAVDLDHDGIISIDEWMREAVKSTRIFSMNLAYDRPKPKAKSKDSGKGNTKGSYPGKTTTSSDGKTIQKVVAEDVAKLEAKFDAEQQKAAAIIKDLEAKVAKLEAQLEAEQQKAAAATMSNNADVMQEAENVKASGQPAPIALKELEIASEYGVLPLGIVEITAAEWRTAYIEDRLLQIETEIKASNSAVKDKDKFESLNSEKKMLMAAKREDIQALASSIVLAENMGDVETKSIKMARGALATLWEKAEDFTDLKVVKILVAPWDEELSKAEKANNSESIKLAKRTVSTLWEKAMWRVEKFKTS